MNLSRNQKLALVLGLIAYAVVLRLLPHPDNFAPLTAVAIFGGAHFSRRQGIATALMAAVLSDALVGFYTFAVMATVWASYGLIAAASNHWLNRPTIVRGSLFTLASSSFFFVATNFAVWIASDYYPHSLAGLGQCFALALPFFRNSLFGDFFYTAVLFGAAFWIERAATRLSPLVQLKPAP